jgi:hypothetical protein
VPAGVSALFQKVSGSVVSDTKYVWADDEIREARDTSNTVTARYFDEGVEEAGVKYFTIRDHLGSVRQVALNNGTRTALLDYAPFGALDVIGEDHPVPFWVHGTAAARHRSAAERLPRVSRGPRTLVEPGSDGIDRWAESVPLRQQHADAAPR